MVLLVRRGGFVLDSQYMAYEELFRTWLKASAHSSVPYSLLTVSNELDDLMAALVVLAILVVTHLSDLT